MPATRSFPEFCAEVRERYAKAGAGRIDPELPFRMCDEHGASFDPVTNLLLAAGAILLALAAAITAIFTTGLVFQALAGLTVVLFVVWLLRRGKEQRLGARWQREATPFPAALVMAHASVHRPGNSVVPGCLLVDFGPAPDPERMAEAAQAAFATTDDQATQPAAAPIRAWLQTEMQRARFGRIRLPRELAGNDTSWLVSLRLDRTAMPQGHLDRAVWFVKARADRDESCELLHHRYWTEGA